MSMLLVISEQTAQTKPTNTSTACSCCRGPSTTSRGAVHRHRSGEPPTGRHGHTPRSAPDHHDGRTHLNTPRSYRAIACRPDPASRHPSQSETPHERGDSIPADIPRRHPAQRLRLAIRRPAAPPPTTTSSLATSRARSRALSPVTAASPGAWECPRHARRPRSAIGAGTGGWNCVADVSKIAALRRFAAVSEWREKGSTWQTAPLKSRKIACCRARIASRASAGSGGGGGRPGGVGVGRLDDGVRGQRQRREHADPPVDGRVRRHFGHRRRLSGHQDRHRSNQEPRPGRASSPRQARGRAGFIPTTNRRRRRKRRRRPWKLRSRRSRRHHHHSTSASRRA